uniref:beta strand repeat-containing protein n=1 Tax=Sphingomonas asaccharolytica TaxID=40681 RepID=UPI000A3DA7FE
NVTVNAGDVTSTGNTAIIAQQTKVAGAGNVDVTAGNVSGTTGIDAHNFGTGTVSVTANGTVAGTAAEGIKATGNDAVSVSVADTVTGATNGLTLVGGTGGAGNISVTGTGGFLGGTGDAANIKNNGSGTVAVDISGASGSTSGEGIVVRDTAAGGNIDVTTGAVTALAAGKDGIDVQSLSTTGNVFITANGDVNAGNAGIVGALLTAGGTGNIDITANGAIDARFGVDAENFGSGSTSVTTIGPVTATSGNGVFALTHGGDVLVTSGDVSSLGETAIVARQTNAAGAGSVGVTANNVSGTTGIEATNSGSGVTIVDATGAVTGTTFEGIKATGNDAVRVFVADTVTGATNGLTLVGGTGGAGDILVTGAGGFQGGTGDAANIKNNGSGTVTVDISGASGSTGGNGIIVRDTAVGGDISVTTGAVTAPAVGKNAIDVQSLSNTANVTEVANGDIQAGNAGMVAAIFPAAATGNIDVTANGAIDARFGVDAENFGSGAVKVTTVGPVTVADNGIFAGTKGGNVTVNAGDVTSS